MCTVCEVVNIQHLHVHVVLELGLGLGLGLPKKLQSLDLAWLLEHWLT